jgi:hypothetical protein
VQAHGKALKMLRLAICAATLLLLGIRPSVADGPFGFEMGQNIQSLPGCRKDGEYYYKCPTAPRSHSSFETYQLIYTDVTGICAVIGVGNTISTGSNGFGLRSEYDRVAEQLQQNYGPTTKNDFLIRGSIWRDPTDWMMGLLKKDRYLSQGWHSSASNSLKNKINAILLSANALTTEKGYLGVRYEFNNFDQCSKVIKDREAGAL